MRRWIKRDIDNHSINKYKFIIFMMLTMVFYKNINAQKYSTMHQKDFIESQILKGNNDIYYEISETMFGSIELLPYSIIMGSIYNNGVACFDVYYIISSTFEYYKLDVDTFLIEIAIKFLIRGADLNNWNCCLKLSKLYKEGIWVEQDIQKSIMYKEKAQGLTPKSTVIPDPE